MRLVTAKQQSQNTGCNFAQNYLSLFWIHYRHRHPHLFLSSFCFCLVPLMPPSMSMYILLVIPVYFGTNVFLSQETPHLCVCVKRTNLWYARLCRQWYFRWKKAKLSTLVLLIVHIRWIQILLVLLVLFSDYLGINWLFEWIMVVWLVDYTRNVRIYHYHHLKICTHTLKAIHTE